MSILIKTVRICGFRGLKNIEVELEKITVLTGMNNSGKTSFLKALQVALGNRQFISQDDFYIQGNTISEKVVIDILIIPVNVVGKKEEDFSEEWETLFTTNRIRTDNSETAFVPLRTIITFDPIRNSYKTQQYILQSWPVFINENKVNWFQVENGKDISFRFDELPFFYMDAQRDILEDLKIKNSYLGKMISKIEYSKEAIEALEIQIKSLNETAVNSSDILSNIKSTLKELDTAMDTHSEGIEITPFTKKIRDLNKGLSIYYADQKDSFSMEYHGMGTRSWSSLLTLKSFILLLDANAKKENTPFFPVLAIEEPEAHLHPNAQKKLYRQLSTIAGQKIISTHSPYIAATADLSQIRNFYKNDALHCGKINTEILTPEDIRKINRQVINTRGEIFFSRLLVFFEGETEEQALPLFFEKYFDKTSVEMGIDFIGVAGYENYLPFLRFSEELKIPWLILSDAEPKAKAAVKKQLEKLNILNGKNTCVTFLDDGNDLEHQWLADGFSTEIKQAIISFKTYQNDHHRQAKEQECINEINSYNDEKLYECITADKARFGRVVAEEIVKSEKALSPKIVELFKKIEALTSNKEAI